MASLFLSLVIPLVILGLVYYVLTALVPMPDPIGRVVHVIFVVIVALVVLQALLPLLGVSTPFARVGKWC